VFGDDHNEVNDEAGPIEVIGTNWRTCYRFSLLCKVYLYFVWVYLCFVGQ